ncbi:MAG TPA: hypothetical protein VGJ86_20690 [Acidimicrobiales bacterium]
MSAAELLSEVVRALDAAGIPHMLVGSFASTSYGAPRATQDIDIVIDPTPDALERFVTAFSSDRIYVSPTAQEALGGRDQFNLIDFTTGWKVDLMIRKDRPFSRSEFARRVRARALDVDLYVATAEDTVLAKLEWAAIGGSDRQLADAATVLAVSADTLDYDYLDRWAAELGVSELLARAKER